MPCSVLVEYRHAVFPEDRYCQKTIYCLARSKGETLQPLVTLSEDLVLAELLSVTLSDDFENDKISTLCHLVSR